MDNRLPVENLKSSAQCNNQGDFLSLDIRGAPSLLGYRKQWTIFFYFIHRQSSSIHDDWADTHLEKSHQSRLLRMVRSSLAIHKYPVPNKGVFFNVASDGKSDLIWSDYCCSTVCNVKDLIYVIPSPFDVKGQVSLTHSHDFSVSVPTVQA